MNGYVVNPDTVLDKGYNVKIGHGTVIGGYPMMFEKGTRKLIFGTKRVKIGNNVVIGNNVTIMGGFWDETVIGDNTRIWDGTVIGHDCKIGNNVAIVVNCTLNGRVEVGDWSFIGSGVVVKPRVKIGKYVQVGIGSVVRGDVPEGVVVVGNENPPRIIRKNEWRPDERSA